MSDENQLYLEDPELLENFLTESQEFNQTLNDCLLEGEEALKKGETLSDEKINEMFRAAHTIKGTSAFIGLDNINHLTHEMETLLDRVRDGKMALSLAIIDVLFKAFDTLEELFSKLNEEQNEDVDTGPAIAKIKALLEGGQPEEPALEAQPQPEGQSEAQAEPAAPESPAATGGDALKEEEIERYLPQFLDDVSQMLEHLDALLMQFETDPTNEEIVTKLFREFHTLKGSAGLLNREDMSQVSHRIEDILTLVREHKISSDATMYPLLFEGVDSIKSVAQSLKNREFDQHDVSDLVSRLDDYRQSKLGVSETASSSTSSSESDDLVTSVKEAVSQAFEDDKDVFSVTIVVDKQVGFKPVKVSIVEEALKKIGSILGTKPAIDDIPMEVDSDLKVELILSSIVSEREIRQALIVDEVNIDLIERIDKSIFASPEPAEEIKPEPAAVSEPQKAQPQPKAVAKPKVAAPKKAAADKKQVESSTIRIDTRKLDKLMNLTGELVITKARLAQLHHHFDSEIHSFKEDSDRVSEFNKEFRRLKQSLKKTHLLDEVQAVTENQRLVKGMSQLGERLERLEGSLKKKHFATHMRDFDEMNNTLSKISSDIQTGIMQARMIPVEGVFSRFKRVVRDLSKELNKDVQLEILGEDTEMDKKIIDELGNPLTHMVRNAMDHGIETKEERAATDKNPRATLRLAAYHRGNNICIEIGDDGKGIDENIIANKAIEKGIVTEDQVESMTKREKLNLIFAPGFSTAEQVTDLSGRGVGMDVVKNMITSIKGTIEIQSDIGKGTRFILNIPLTLAIIQALLVSIGGEPYAFPLNSVTEIIKVLPNDIYSIDGNDTVRLREHALSLVRLKDVLRLQENQLGEDVKSFRVVVVKDGDEQIGVVVEKLIGEEEIVIKALSSHFSHVKGIAGASVLGDGRIALILDASSILQESK